MGQRSSSVDLGGGRDAGQRSSARGRRYMPNLCGRRDEARKSCQWCHFYIPFILLGSSSLIIIR